MIKIIIFILLVFQCFVLLFSKTLDINIYSIEQKIAQMLILGFRGTYLENNSKMLKFMKEYSVGGVILFDKDIPMKKYIRNIENPK